MHILCIIITIDRVWLRIGHCCVHLLVRSVQYYYYYLYFLIYELLFNTLAAYIIYYRMN